VPSKQLPSTVRNGGSLSSADLSVRYGRPLTREEWDELLAEKDGVCRLCARPDQQLVYEHDHAVGRHACRGWTCQRCNCHMAGVDAGRYAIDPATRQYLVEPWHLKRLGQRLAYNPTFPIKVSDLNSADRYEIDRLSWEFISGEYGMRRNRPRFEHPDLAVAIGHGNFRPLLRLRYLNIRGLRDLDITHPDDRLSSFQRLHLKHLLPEPAYPWAHIAADAA
jgi:recombination endonuclease VII